MFGLFEGGASGAAEICASITDELKAAMPECAIHSKNGDPFHLEARAPDRSSLQLFLGNLVTEVQSVGSRIAREELISAYVAMARQALYPPELSLDAVYPALRHRSFYDQLGGVPKDDPLLKDGPGDLVAVVLADIGQGLQTLNTAACEKAGLSPEDVVKAAEANFLEILPELGTCQPVPGILAAGFSDYPWLGSSLLFTPNILELIMEDKDWDRALVTSTTRETVDLANADLPSSLSRMERWMNQRLDGDPRTQSEFLWTISRRDGAMRKTHRLDEEGRLVALV